VDQERWVMANEHPTEPVPLASLLGIRLLVACATVWLVAALPFLTDTAGVDLFNFNFWLVIAWFLLTWHWLRVPFASPVKLRSRPSRRLWLMTGAVCVLGAILIMTDLGLVARLYLCERQVVAYVSGVAPKTSEFPHEPRRVGLFQVVGTGGSPGGMVTLSTTTAFNDNRFHGLVYLPGHEGPLVYNKSRTNHLYGPWYALR
jgi:hypothetical protein